MDDILGNSDDEISKEIEEIKQKQGIAGAQEIQ